MDGVAAFRGFFSFVAAKVCLHISSQVGHGGLFTSKSLFT